MLTPLALSQAPLRADIIAAYRRPESDSIIPLIDAAHLTTEQRIAARTLASELVKALRAKPVSRGIKELLHEFSLSSQEGVALMCLAEALLRIPDSAVRDALIRDKLSHGDWKSHIGQKSSLFVNAAAWSLMISGKLLTSHSETGLFAVLSRLIGKGCEPLVRKGVGLAMQLMGEQFVCGETIAQALTNSRKFEARNFRYSYDMLGEAALTSEDAQRYFLAYKQAIHAIGKVAGARDIYDKAGISVKLSALHPRYARAQKERVMAELLPRLQALATLARHYDIGLNIDAEEADRLELSLDLLEALCFDPALAGWNGIGFVIQAYQKRCPFVVDYLIDLALRSQHRLMVRLVKGAYWDSEIKRAQIDGLNEYPVYTRKIYTDVSYLACAKKMLAAPTAIYPQFATHNAYTVAAIYQLAGPNYYAGQYEFQCLHGMGEALYEALYKHCEIKRPCRIYAPVGTHESLLAYLVRRLLENGANTSFVNRIADEAVTLDELIADPVEEALKVAPLGAPHPKIVLPLALYGAERVNSSGLDLSDEDQLAQLSAVLRAGVNLKWQAAPILGGDVGTDTDEHSLVRNSVNPAHESDIVGTLIDASSAAVQAALVVASRAAPAWRMTPPLTRATYLMRAAELLEAQRYTLMSLLVREAGKSLASAVSEIREAVDFLRYYAAQIRLEFSNDTHHPLGPIVCISPWNFPLAIFIGQISAALAAGNPVLAKPAEQTPLIAAQAVRILHEAGVPIGVVQLLPGAGETVGAALVADERVGGVMFTGSTEVARLIAKTLAERLGADGKPIPLIAETGGQNAMIVDSSALAEQVVFDVLVSAFDSAGQRCSALRVLCLQEEVAERILTMLKGAMQELVVGNPSYLATDVGPVIDASAKSTIENHIDKMRAKGCKVFQPLLADAAHTQQLTNGAFVLPTLIEIESINELTHEVFGPVLHVVRYRRPALPTLLDEINRTGYGLTLGLHTRIDETIAYVSAHARVGNLYINRNMVGAVVGVQPFGGEGLSGTGPKAGGPLYLLRLLAQSPRPAFAQSTMQPLPLNPDRVEMDLTRAAAARLNAYRTWLISQNDMLTAMRCERYLEQIIVGKVFVLSGPTGEENLYALKCRGIVRCEAATMGGARAQLAAVLATGNQALFAAHSKANLEWIQRLPESLKSQISIERSVTDPFDAVLFEGERAALQTLTKSMAERTGPLISVQSVAVDALASEAEDYRLERLLIEISISQNTAAAGGNASLMTIT
ncbi:MAG: L-proline dehydrogenase /delta-1-pyrroline-5-carboxylate dehydrogenase [Glomeribacter sp. 1016415]|nr:L-proline dehydrogenase /delta-1-pyrroline-5-carboxylate dehydrogenase [Glomeribacter sp. 1016415]